MEVQTQSSMAAVDLVNKLGPQFIQFFFGVGSFFMIFAIWFLWYGLKRHFQWKIFSFLYTLVCIWVFAFFFGGGILIGQKWNLGALGALIGVFCFWGIFEFMTRLKLRGKKDLY